MFFKWFEKYKSLNCQNLNNLSRKKEITNKVEWKKERKKERKIWKTISTSKKDEESESDVKEKDNDNEFFFFKFNLKFSEHDVTQFGQLQQKGSTLQSEFIKSYSL